MIGVPMLWDREERTREERRKANGEGRREKKASGAACIGIEERRPELRINLPAKSLICLFLLFLQRSRLQQLQKRLVFREDSDLGRDRF